MDKYIITGCGGFVAKHFLDYLEDNKMHCEVLGIDIVSIVLQREYKYLKFHSECIDLLNQQEIEKILCRFQPNYILHLASFSSVAFSWKNPTLSFQNNVNIFLNLLEVLRRYSLPTRILSIGSSEEYGNVSPDILPLTEDLRLNPISPYAVARVSQEMLSKLYVDSFGLDIVITRSFNHIGPGQKDIFVVPSFIRRILEAKIVGKQNFTMEVGNLEIIRDFLDVRDVVKAYFLLLKQGKKGEVYNICSGRPTKLREIIDYTSRLLSIDVTPVTVSSLVRPNDNMVIVGDSSKLKVDTGWSPKYDLVDSIADIIKYWRSELETEFND